MTKAADLPGRTFAGGKERVENNLHEPGGTDVLDVVDETFLPDGRPPDVMHSVTHEETKVRPLPIRR